MARTAAPLHILVKHKEQTDDILAQLKKGRSFTYSPKSIQLAHQAKGGDLGEFRHRQMVPAFDKACFQGEVLTHNWSKPNLVGMW
ncbi:peptidylprolyl isomerase [Vibrio cholerae]|nr:peptidylprolyl isomerase [Vibrio cholerae]